MKNDFGLRGVRERQCVGNEVSLKNYHICYIKLKTRVFHGLGNREISREKHRSFCKKLLVAIQSRDNRVSHCMKLKNFQFLPKNHFARRV